MSASVHWTESPLRLALLRYLGRGDRGWKSDETTTYVAMSNTQNPSNIFGDVVYKRQDCDYSTWKIETNDQLQAAIAMLDAISKAYAHGHQYDGFAVLITDAYRRLSKAVIDSDDYTESGEEDFAAWCNSGRNDEAIGLIAVEWAFDSDGNHLYLSALNYNVPLPRPPAIKAARVRRPGAEAPLA